MLMNRLKARHTAVMLLVVGLVLFGVQFAFAQDEHHEGHEAAVQSEEGVDAHHDIGAQDSPVEVDPEADLEHMEHEEAAHGEGHGEHGGGHRNIGEELPLWSAIPFAGILLSIALFPLFAPHFWHHHFPKISLFWALVFAIPFLIFYKGEAVHQIAHIYLADYIPFIVLLLGLFTASGGILLRGTLVGKPATNLMFLIIGTVLASWMGTTGASMLLIRPVIRANKARKSKMHVIIFFIFLVSNIGGSLTPLGDPPLFLGFLHGVPFFWTMHLLPELGFAAVWLLILFFVVDTVLYNREKDNLEKSLAEHGESEPIKLEGLHNLIFLLGVMGAVLFSGLVHFGQVTLLGVHIEYSSIVRDLFILMMVYLSVKTTSKKIRDDNGFTWFPIQEVAYLFAGIFMTIIPALAILKAGETGALASLVAVVKEPWQFYWVTGALSSFLDNAPTYLVFYNQAQGQLVNALTAAPPEWLLAKPDWLPEMSMLSSVTYQDMLVNKILTHQVPHGPHTDMFVARLTAISVGAVFFGAMTYIGNAPNFMVRSIAEENKITMPSFFGYMLWSLGILGTLFIAVTFVFYL